MKARLTHPDADLDVTGPRPAGADDVASDLELAPLLGAMGGRDRHMREVVEHALLTGAPDLGAISYRQQVQDDCRAHPDLARELYRLATSALEEERQLSFGRFGNEPETILSRGVRVMELLVATLRQMRTVAERRGGEVRSEAMVRFVAMLRDELREDYLRRIEAHLAELRFPDGILLSAELGRGNVGTHYTLRRPTRRGRIARVLERGQPGEAFQLAEEDERGHRALTELRGRATDGVANALAQSCDHIVAFLTTVRAELAFHLAGVNLHRALTELGAAVTTPQPRPATRPALHARGLYDPALALTLGRAPVPNDVEAGEASLVLITGANQGGKSTLLRSLGLAQLLMGAGLPVPADAYEASVATGVLTHFPREEDRSLRRGKLDEELARMSSIVDQAGPGAWVLCNESFASTNEREGAEIARHVVAGLRDGGARVAFVTHMYELARAFTDEPREQVLFLRAERGEGGERPYRLTEGEPLPTSYGQDTFRRVFGRPHGEGARPPDGR